MAVKSKNLLNLFKISVILCALQFVFESNVFMVNATPTVSSSSSLSSPLSTKVNSTECGGEIGEILKELRTLMKDSKILNGLASIEAYIVPVNDAHQNEYIADHDKRLQYISKFTGSAGEGIITMNEALLWTDSRYHLQAEQQLDLNCWTIMKKGLPNVPSPSDWLVNNLAKNSTVAVDPFLYTGTEFRQLNGTLQLKGHKFIGLTDNLVDAIWKTRPAPGQSEIFPIDIQFSGKESNLKISEVMERVRNDTGESIVITTLDDIAWLLNLRGSDIKYNPVFFSYVLLSPTKSYFFVDKTKLNEPTRRQMEEQNGDLIVRDYDRILDGVNEIVNWTDGKIIVSSSSSQAITDLIPAERRLEKDIVGRMKSVKNPIETKNMEKAHIRDGYALVQYLHWLNATIDTENITELSGAARLDQFRAQQDNFRSISFETISAVGEHAAMAHYQPTKETDKQITRNEMYLVDSGGHYWDGTTDVTRTVHFGLPTAEEKNCFTRVLKGFIALVTSVFPKTTTLSYFDNVARRALWQGGLDYGHGTGHGVGMYLSVHEYPPHINAKSNDTLTENVFTSNEPGYYKAHKFGIRIEDVIQVIKSGLEDAFDGQGGLTFKSITYAPLQTKLIDTDMLTKEEANYVNGYNKKVLETIGPILLKHKQMDAHRWLVQETRQICSWAR